MPRFFFHSADGSREPDREGTELPDDRAAYAAAVRYAGAVLAESRDVLARNGQWRIEVTDDTGRLLFTIVTLAVVAPDPKDLKAAYEGETPGMVASE